MIPIIYLAYKSYKNLMLNSSAVGYKTFASQFADHPKEGHLQTNIEQKSLIIKKDKVSLLHSLCAENNSSLLQRNQNQQTLLHYAAYFNSPTCAFYLLYKGLDISSLDKQGKSLFHLSAYTGHLQVLKVVIQFWKVVKIKSLNQKFINILEKIGFKRTDAKCGKLKSQVSQQRLNKFNKGRQQIFYIYRQYRKEYTQFILKNYQLQDIAFNRNCFHFTALNKYQKCLATLQYIIKSLHNQDLNMDQELYLYMNDLSPLIPNIIDPRQYQDCLDIIQDFLSPQRVKEINYEQNNLVKQKMSQILQAKDKENHTPIFLASKTGSATIVSLLKKMQSKYCCHQKNNKNSLNDELIKVALNNSSRNQIVDLCSASKTADIQIMNFLISCGEEVNKKKSIFGTFALLQAVKAFEKQKNLQPLKVLLKSGADVNQQDSNGWTIFHHIAQKGHTQILKQLFKQKDQKRISKLKINKTTNKGYHPLHIAALNNRKEIIEIMLTEQNIKKYQINENPLDQQKSTILHLAAKKGCLETMKKILQLKGKNLIDIKDINDNTCLHLAASNNHAECIRQLIYFDSDYDRLIKIRNKKGKLAKDLTLKKKYFDSIFTASREGDVNMIRNLANEKSGIIDNTTPIKKRTPLILSVMELQLVNVKFLVELGADQYHEDQQGKSASQYAEQLQALYSKKDRSKLPLIKKIKAILD